MTDMSIDDVAVKRTAVRLLSTACDGLLAEDAPLSAALAAALRSPNDPLFIYNYRVAESEFSRLPRETSDTLMLRCQSRIAVSQEDILAEIRGFRAETREPAPRLLEPRKSEAKRVEIRRPSTEIRWS
jgi:hypothetical protein